MALNQRTDAGASGQRVDFSGFFFAWVRSHTGLWMCLVWIPVFLFAPTADIVHMAQSGSEPGWSIALAVVFLTGLAATFAGSVIPAAGGRGGFGVEASLVLLAGLACAAMVSFGWVAPFALPAIACGVVLQLRHVLPVIVVISLFAAAVVGIVVGSFASAAGAAVLTFLAGLGNFVIHRLASAIAELDATRSELARAAIVAERARFARDLHDLLGHTLSVIVVKAEATRRLVPVDPDAAAGHAADIESISRNALTEVREVVSGYRSVRLGSELDAARETLTDAGITPGIRNEIVSLTGQAEGLLGWVVREGVTNVVRHSGADRCTIVARQDGDNGDTATVLISDNGSTAPVGAPDSSSGWGLAGLRERTAALGGRLIASADDGGFRLIVHVPVEARANNADSTGTDSTGTDDGGAGR
ncbi:sensor histidine kinase [Arthrobacter castelli]|uniref:sensor histidine kinase n=1 Tax=Arthrobacter castelli TaxID=271431 RepID=UPI00041810CC|nr:histidine kinase [Arthrobacter castelli]